MGVLKRIIATLAICLPVAAAYLLAARPSQSHWGATPEEVSRPMPGDSLALLLFLFAIGWILFRGFTPGRILMAYSAGAAWLITWYAQLSIWICMLPELLVLLGLIRTAGTHRTTTRNHHDDSIGSV